MEQIITHNAVLDHGAAQSYSSPLGVVYIDFNGMGGQGLQKWSIEDAGAIVRLLTSAIADAEWRA